MSEFIRLTLNEAVAAVTLDRGGEGNQLTIPMVRELAAVFREAGRSDAKVITLRSVGTDFCLGRDTRGGPTGGPPPNAVQMRTNLIVPLLDVYEAISSAPQPVICSVQGAAAGFGCALATACDITIASDTARFKLPELEKNLPPTLAISAMMSRVPQKALTWLVYSMREVDAQTALRLGIVSEVVAPANLVAESDKLVTELSTRARDALIGIKDYVRAAPGLQGRAVADLAGNLLATVFSSVPRG
jgi:enoyl-CoA hydratase